MSDPRAAPSGVNVYSSAPAEETVLIVEDERDQADMTAHLLRFHGMRPLLAPTGGEGLHLARTARPDVVLLDLMLPDIDGFEVCRRLRTEPETMALPIVMLTALGDRVHRVRGFRGGANAYVGKPYDAAELLEAIDSARTWRDHLREGRIQGEIVVELNSEITFLQEVSEFLQGLWVATSLGHDQIMHLRQAVMELGHNAIEWGNRHQVELMVRILYRVYDDRVEIIIRDQGSGFDPRNLPHAAKSEDPLTHMDVRETLGLREGGFGLLICKGMVDELRYNDIGNEVTLIKRLPTPLS